MAKHTKRRERQQARALKQGIGLPEIDWDSLIRHQDDREWTGNPPYDDENIHDDGMEWDDDYNRS